MATCSFADCFRRVQARGLCNKHYQRFWKHGDASRDQRSDRRPLADRFWEKVDRRGPRECWPWKSRSNVRGYGYLQRGGRNGGRILAHRLSWELHRGSIPDGLEVCHECDNPPCCNPAHLFLGTQADNNADAVAKGRARFTFAERPELTSGEANVHAKLTAQRVNEIRALRAAGLSQREIAERFGVTRQNIRAIVRKLTWRNAS